MHSVIKEADLQNGGFPQTPQNGGFRMLLQVMKMSQSVQLPTATTVSSLCDPYDAITAWQRRFMLPMSLWMAVISQLFHCKHCVNLKQILSSIDSPGGAVR